MKPRRRTPKRHATVGTWPAAEIIAAEPRLAKRDRQLTEDGYRRSDWAKVWRRRDGGYTVRIVWRRREDGLSVAWTETMRYEAVEIREVPA